VHRSAARWGGAGVVAVDAGGGEFGVVTVVSDGMPTTTLFSGEGSRPS